LSTPGPEEIQDFLQKTKNMRDVKVEDHFPDKEKFYSATRLHLASKGKGMGGEFKQVEIYRLRKVLLKISKEIHDDRDDVTL